MRCAVAVTLFCSLLHGSSLDDFSKFLETSFENARRGDYVAAMADVQAALRLEPNNSVGWQRLGLLLGELADFRGAETAFRRAVQLRPTMAEAHYNLGLALIAQPESKLDWPGAIEQFREALKYRPDYPEALNLIGAGLLATDQDKAAVAQLEHAIQLKPTFAEAHFNLGLCFEKLDRMQEAAREYRLSIAARQAYPEAQTALAKLLSRNGKLNEAQLELEKALRTNPDLGDAHYALAKVLQALDKPREATLEFAAAHQLAQRKTNAIQSATLSNQGLSAAAKGDLIHAIALLWQAVALKPDYGIPHHNLGLLLADTGDLRNAADEIVKAASLLPGQSKPWYHLGRILRQLGDKAGALEAFQLASGLAPDNKSIRDELTLAKNDGAPDSEHLRISLGPKADTAVAHAAFAVVLFARHDYLGEVGELLRTLSLQPAASGARRELAAAYWRLAEPEAARTEYLKALRVDPADSLAYRGLGQLLLDIGDISGAITALREALRLNPYDEETRFALKRAAAR